MDEEEVETMCEKEARCKACALKKMTVANHKEFMEAWWDAWEAAKLDYKTMVEIWTKPMCLKQNEVYSLLGLDNEELWNN